MFFLPKRVEVFNFEPITQKSDSIQYLTNCLPIKDKLVNFDVWTIDQCVAVDLKKCCI